jgi:hypothetical protein
MFLLNGSPLSLDIPFTDADGIQRPANWLRFATPEEREAAGITEVADIVRPDDRFYWVDSMNAGVPKDLDQLKAEWTKQIDQIAYTRLLPTDWMIVRKAEVGTEIPAATTTYRAAIRAAVAENKKSIAEAANIEDFITVATSLKWPDQV